MLLNNDTYLQKIPQLANLFKRSFGRSIDPLFLKWRYFDNPHGEMLVNVQIEDETIIANYSASPCILNIDGYSLKTALSMTTMTDPAFAGRGLFNKLASELYNHMTEKRYGMIWGFPNFNSHYSFVNKLGWTDIYELPTMQLVLKAQPIDSGCFETDNQFLLNYEQSQNFSGLNYVVKDHKYLQWRYARNPLNQYTNVVLAHDGYVSSYCVIKSYQQQLDIVDFQAKDRDEGHVLLRQVMHFALKNDMEAVNCWAPRHHFMHGLCERLGFVNREPITYLGAKVLASGLQNNSVYNYSKWFIQMGDSDVY